MRIPCAIFTVLAIALAGQMVHAGTENFTFDADLTNKTEWVYSDLKRFKEGYALGKSTAEITSPRFDFAITSVVFSIKKAGGSSPRDLKLKVLESKNLVEEATLVPDGSDEQYADVSHVWDFADGVRRFSLYNSSGSGNLYIFKAAISGEFIVRKPIRLEAGNISGTRFSISWVNDGRAPSNRVDVVERIRFPGQGNCVRCMDFNGFSNYEWRSKEIDDAFYEVYPELSGTKLYFPSNSTGQIQLSTSTDKGVLVHDGFDDYSDLTIRIVAKRYNHKDEYNTMSVSYAPKDGSSTNLIDNIALDYGFTTNHVMLSSVPQGSKLILNSEGNKTRHRVIIDELAFISGYIPEHEEAVVKQFVVEGRNSLRVKGLVQNTLYFVTVTAFDSDGNQSEPSEQIEVMTNSKKPYTVILMR